MRRIKQRLVRDAAALPEAYPRVIWDILSHSEGLNFDQRPDYAALRDTIRARAQEEGVDIDAPFPWAPVGGAGPDSAGEAPIIELKLEGVEPSLIATAHGEYERLKQQAFAANRDALWWAICDFHFDQIDEAERTGSRHSVGQPPSLAEASDLAGSSADALMLELAADLRGEALLRYEKLHRVTEPTAPCGATNTAALLSLAVTPTPAGAVLSGSPDVVGPQPVAACCDGFADFVAGAIRAYLDEDAALLARMSAFKARIALLTAGDCITPGAHGTQSAPEDAAPVAALAPADAVAVVSRVEAYAFRGGSLVSTGALQTDEGAA